MIDDDEMVKALRRALPPCGEAAPPTGLWPKVARRIAAPRAAAARGDWALAGLSLLWLLVFPQGIAALLFLL